VLIMVQGNSSTIGKLQEIHKEWEIVFGR